ncbi:hypothetical protein HPP92_002431 [Vanilla planifolia]|uniref:Uncharacterized protein n=1 Tax=Vanilla planifolia TaxID=51239 RepID=A0A835VIY5_VANPL|nr:hypothetical protein HPP92_002784 [Vanilla planifolia]KAG0502359.1 hypothetical protein HPP92_002431 [Vanilla planifolia]
MEEEFGKLKEELKEKELEIELKEFMKEEEEELDELKRRDRGGIGDGIEGEIGDGIEGKIRGIEGVGGGRIRGIVFNEGGGIGGGPRNWRRMILRRSWEKLEEELEEKLEEFEAIKGGIKKGKGWREELEEGELKKERNLEGIGGTGGGEEGTGG